MARAAGLVLGLPVFAIGVFLLWGAVLAFAALWRSQADEAADESLLTMVVGSLILLLYATPFLGFGGLLLIEGVARGRHVAHSRGLWRLRRWISAIDEPPQRS